MKTIIKSSLVLSLALIGWAGTQAQSTTNVQQICIGSGVHCATLEYGIIKMTFVKSPKAPGILIKEESK